MSLKASDCGGSPYEESARFERDGYSIRSLPEKEGSL